MTEIDDGATHWRRASWIAAAGLVLLPLVAMQFTTEVRWDGADFLVFGAMLIVACGAVELAVRLTRRTGIRLLAGGAIAAAFLIVWADLAVGIF